MRPSKPSKVAALLLLTACGSPPLSTPPTTTLNVSPVAAVVPATDVVTAAKIWTTRWWTTPGDPLRRDRAVAAISAPSLTAQLAPTHSATATDGCERLRDVKTFIGRSVAMEVTVTATCIAAGSPTPVVLTVRFARIDGRVLVDAVR